MNEQINNLLLLAEEEGFNETPLKGVGVYRASRSSERVPLCYSQGIIIVVQGNKRVHHDHKTYDYNPDNYLVLALPLSAECETIVETDKPLLSLMIDFDLGLLGELVRYFDEHHEISRSAHQSETKGLFVNRCTEEMHDAITRLSRCLLSPLQCDVMGQSLVREILFYILKGRHSSPMFALVTHNTHLSRLERVLKHLNSNYQEQFDIEHLAAMANMSSSSFHRNFRQVTASSPIQYVKKIRLNRAKELLLDRGIKVKQAAAQVGYESPTQFSREFKRYFGESPQDVARL